MAAGIGITKNLGDLYARLSFLTLDEVLKLKYSFYEFDYQDDGSINRPYSIQIASNLTMDLGRKWSLSAQILFVESMASFESRKFSSGAGLELGFSPTKLVSLALGIASFGGVLAADGQSYELPYFDSRNSTIYLNVVLSI